MAILKKHGAPPAGTRVNPLMHVPVPWAFVLAFLAGVGLQFLCPVTLVQPGTSLASALIYAGVALAIAGGLCAGWCLKIFRSVKTTTVPFEVSAGLVTWGPYKLSRNPMYLSLTVVYIGETLIFREVWALGILFLVLAYLNWIVIPVEERQLRQTFGKKYEDYCGKVRRWI